MLRATSIVRKAAVKEDRVADTAWLDHRARLGGHAAVESHGGLEISLALARASPLGDGDALRLEDGRLIRVKAAPEALLEIRAENPLRLLRFAWQLGQLHVSPELKSDAVYVPLEPGLAELARGQGCIVTKVTRPFQPERADEHACDHPRHGHGGHHHDHDHAGHERGRSSQAGHDHAGHDHADHEHGAACGCGHDHKHGH